MVHNSFIEVAAKRSKNLELESAGQRSLNPVRKMPTGIRGFDYGIGGGLPDKALYLTLGDPGSSHQIFVLQTLFNRVVSKGTVSYFTVESSSIDLIEDMATFQWGVEKYMDDASWLFQGVKTPELQKLSELTTENPLEKPINVSSVSLDGLKAELLVRVKEGRWTALGLSYLLLHYELPVVVDLILYWLSTVRTFGGVHFVVLSTGIHDPRHVSLIRELVDGVIGFSIAPKRGEIGGTLTIEKMRRTLVKSRVFEYVLLEQGISIETAQRIA